MPAALISQMDPPPGERDAFESWYSDEHVPLRMGIPGFTGAVRGWAVDGEPSHLVVYWMNELGVLATPEYRTVKEEPSELTRHMLDNVAAFTRWTCDEISDTGAAGEDGRFLYLVLFGPPPEAQPEFDDWYEREHVPMLMENDDWLRVRRYAVQNGEPSHVTRIALHELRSLDALSSPEREAARSTDWRARLSNSDWFAPAYATYERHQDFAATRG